MKLIQKYEALPIQAKASFWFLMASLLQKGLSVLTAPIFSRIMTTADYGNYNVFQAWMSIITILVTMNMFYGMYLTGLVKFEQDRNRFASSLQGLVLVMTLIGTCIYLAFQSLWNELLGLTTVQMLSMFLLIWTSAVFSFWAMEQKIDFHYKKLLALTVAVSIAKAVLGVVAVLYAEDKVTARILSVALVQVVGFAFLFCVHMKRGRCFYSRKYWLHALTFCIPLIPHYLSSTILSTMDRIMIEKMVGASAAGIYSLAYAVSLLMTMFSSALLSTVEPWLFRKISEKKITDIGQVGHTIFVVVAAVNLILIAFAPEIIAIFAPAEYYEAIWVIPPVAMSAFFMFSYSMFVAFQFHFQKTLFITLATTVGAVVNIVLNYVFIPQFGYICAGYTTLVCYMLYAMAHYLFMRKICKDYLARTYPYKTKVLLQITCIFMTVGFLYLLTYQNTLWRYTLTLLLLLISSFGYIGKRYSCGKKNES